MTLFETLTAAVRDMSEHGYDSPERIAMWAERIREAAKASMMPEADLADLLRRNLGAIYQRMIERGAILQLHPELSRYTIASLQPKLHAELSRRLLASTDLIKLNRVQAVEKTVQRFVGWGTSIPAGGSDVVTPIQTKQDIRKSLAQLPFEERRVAIDQGAKLTAALSDIVATENGALAGIWHSHWRQSGYNYRPDHKERDQHIYAIRGNWALAAGLMKAGPDGYSDEDAQPAELPFCRCKFQWIYTLHRLPSDMLTQKGRAELDRVRVSAIAGG